MFCSKCGQPLSEGARFCSKCGWEVSLQIGGSKQTANFNSASQKNKRSLRCPKCYSENIQLVTSTASTSRGVSICNSCCGYILLGPLGLLCGLNGAGKSSTSTSEFWICRSCGARFGDYEADWSFRENLNNVRQELRTVSEQYKEQCNRLKAECPEYKKADDTGMIGAGIIILALIIGGLSHSLPVAVAVGLIGLAICIVAIRREEKIFDKIASPELKRLREEKEALERMKEKLSEKEKKLKEKSGLRD